MNWRKYRDFRKIEHSGGSLTYIITVDGEKIEISEEIYKAYLSQETARFG